MQTSGEKDERMIVRAPAKREIIVRMVSMKMLSSMVIGATPEPTAS
jgi:hypothetical protein